MTLVCWSLTVFVWVVVEVIAAAVDAGREYRFVLVVTTLMLLEIVVSITVNSA